MITNKEKLEQVKSLVRDVPNFPKEGILFKDITPILLNPEALNNIADIYVDYYKDKGITKVVGIESRGFILGSVLAQKLNAGFVPVRKPGKLPYKTLSKSYELEYGTDTVEIHTDAINENDVVLLHDDLLATGGTAQAVIELLNEFNPQEIFTSFIIELEFLNGIERLQTCKDIFSLIKY